MDKKLIKSALKSALDNSPKRNFKQAIDLIITLKGFDPKKGEAVDFFTQLHFPRHRTQKICGFVGQELYDQAKEVLDNFVYVNDFKNFSDKKALKKLANEYDFFIAQANIMAKVAQTFGRVLGPRGKMPNPKAGCVVPPNANLTQLKEQLQYTTHIKIKGQLQYQATVGYEDTPEEEIIDNIETIYSQLVHHLPQEKNNIQDIFLKLTMGKPVKIGEVQEGGQ